MTGSAVSLNEALRFWLKLGFVSFGGPAGQIAIMHRELVEERRWISERRFLHALNYCMILPGPEAQQLATYIGWLMHGALGGIAAGALFVLPSLVILIALSWIYMAFGRVGVVAGLLYGIKPAVTAIVVHAAWRIGGRVMRNAWLAAIGAAAFVAIFVFNAPFPAIVLGAAVIGGAGGRWLKAAFSPSGSSPPTSTAAASTTIRCVIDDDTPTPEHARFRWASVAVVAAVGLGLWAGALALLVAHSGMDGTLASMASFFTRAALLTFGGAYAVLPYVYAGAVGNHHWLTGPQMMDGLALGETTPGPLIMVVAFVGFVGGWGGQVLGGEALFLGGALAAGVATFFTFLPSFLFILLGGPFIETTHGQLKFTAPLTAITAAVVGVIVNLAVFFAWHVWWPRADSAHPFSGGFDGFAALLTLAASTAIFRYRAGVIPLIAACGLAGVLAKFLAGL
jgi:chromate transporter